MADTSWDEVGQRFADLGRKLQSTWQHSVADDGARSELKDAGDKVKAALDDLADSINRAAGSPDVQDATRSATSSIADALASTLHQVAEWLEHPPHKDHDEPRDEPRD